MLNFYCPNPLVPETHPVSWPSLDKTFKIEEVTLPLYVCKYQMGQIT